VGLSQGVFGFAQKDNQPIIFQRIQGLSFPQDAGKPMQFNRKGALQKIRSLWVGEKKAQ